MTRPYLKPELQVIKMQMMEMISQTGVSSEERGVGYGGKDEGGFIDPSGNARNPSAEAFWSMRED